jgi:hypothetical protein
MNSVGRDMIRLGVGGAGDPDLATEGRHAVCGSTNCHPLSTFNYDYDYDYDYYQTTGWDLPM